MSTSNPPEKNIQGVEKQPELVRKEAVIIKPKSKTALAGEYGVHRNTISQWCRDIKIVVTKKLSIQQVKAFYKHYDLPGQYVME